ncbi:MAG: oligosaccharide flippase family protein [Methanothrix sp.]|nr:oligosaccharide flippase family protein [Methanothrix sp.]
MRLFDSLLASLTHSRDQVIPLTSVTSATVFNSMVGFIVTVVAAKNLGAEGFGVFSLAFSVATLVGAIGDFGFNLTMIRLFNRYQAKPEIQTMVLGAAFGFKTLLLAFVVLTCLPIGGFLALSLDLGPTESELFAIAIVTGGFLFFWTYLQSYLQSYRSFGKLSGYILGYAGLRMACLPVAYVFFPENPLVWLIATYTIPVAVLILVGVIPKGPIVVPVVLRQPGASLGILGEMLKYGKWVALSAIAYIAMPYLIRFILAIHGSVVEVGIFSAGMTFTMAFATLNTAVRAVIFPQVTALNGTEQMGRYLKKLKIIAPYYVVAAALGIVALGLLQWFVLGEEYREALPVFAVTGIAFAIVMFLGLGTMLVHTMMKPEIDALTNVGRLCLMLILALLLVPSLGALGGAIAYVAPLLIGEILMFLYVKQRSCGYS